jgi:hypothetical protein
MSIARLRHAFVVALLGLWALIEVGFGFVPAVRPSSHFGFSFASDGTVESVARDSSASAARIRPGDRIELDRLAAAMRYRLVHGWAYKPAGTGLVVVVDRSGRQRIVRLTSRQDTFGRNEWSTLIATLVVSVVFVGIAGILVWLRPNSVTWPFYVFACGYVIIQFGTLQAFLDPPASTVHWLLVGAGFAMAIVGGGLFTVHFPDGVTSTLARRYQRLLVPAAIVVVALYLSLAFGQENGASESTLVAIARGYQLSLVIILGFTVWVLIRRQAGSSGEARQRTQWVVAASAVGLSAIIVDFVLRLLRLPDFNGSPLDIALSIAIVLIPLAVAYAVLRHRIIDVRFAIDRALVYGLLTSGLILLFSLLEWLLSKKLEATRLASYVELGTALVIGFSFDRMHRRVDGFVERAFFRKQHLAQQRLERVALALPHAGSPETVDGFLTVEPLEAYSLRSAAVFRRNGDGVYDRSAAIGWDGHTSALVSDAEPVIAHLSASRSPIGLDDIRTGLALPSGPARPVLAVPVAARNQLLAFVLYGPHAGGEMLDPDERTTLAGLAVAAAAAYDHLDALALKQQLDALRQEVAVLRARGI